MIEVRNLHKGFNGEEILKGISTAFDRGKTNLIIGTSGSGKTVFLKCLLGLFTPEEEAISYDGSIYSELNEQQQRDLREQMGMVFQGSALFDSMTVEQNVMFPLNVLTKMPMDEKLERVNFCLERVSLQNANKLMPSEISGGMMKRVGIARAIVNNPNYLFCDEPNSGLDPKTAILIDNLIQEITEEFDITTVVNTHDMNSVMNIGDKIMFLYHGKKEWEGTNKEILYSNNKALEEFIFVSDLIKR